jgi:hypothetical protein
MEMIMKPIVRNENLNLRIILGYWNYFSCSR